MISTTPGPAEMVLVVVVPGWRSHPVASEHVRRSNGAAVRRLTAEPLGGDRRSPAVEAHAESILRTFEACRDKTIQDLRGELPDQGRP